MKLSIFVTALALVASTPGRAQSVEAGIGAWQKGDYGAAVAAWTPLAATGDADAAFNLGQAYRLGKGVPVDLTRAQHYFEAAARKGNVDAATTLGILLFQNGNRIAALRWLSKAADAGEPRAMLLFGTALYNGDGIAPDPVRAYALVSRAAAQGLGAGQATLGEMDQAMPLEQRRKGLALAKAMVASAAKSVAPARPTTTRAGPAAPVPAGVAAVPPTAVASALPAARGAWRIQLGAFGQRAAAEALFARWRSRLDGRAAFYVAAGPVVRLQVGPYASRGAAAAACAALGGQPCFAVPAR